MSDPEVPEVGKGEGRGKGKWTVKGVQAQQGNDIEALKALVAEMAARLDELETEPEAPPA